MGAGASANDVQQKIGEASQEEVQACIDAMDAESRAKLSAALGPGAGSAAKTGAAFGPVDTSALAIDTVEFDAAKIGLQDQPADPKFKICLVGAYDGSKERGGSDKLTNGHRFDTIGICNGFINNGMSCQPIYYTPDNHDAFFETLKQFDGVIVRVNPGQIKGMGGNQKQFDDAMMGIAATKPVWPQPAIMESMGAKDALCCIRDMDFGLKDTIGYYSPEDMQKDFPKTIAFQPRVVKQNRGSAGEGIWIIKLKSGEYCANFGDAEAKEDDVLILTEANDSHVEEHTVKEFMEFCINGRTEASGEWKSIGTGKYFEGGREAGGQMVDQRFLPRIDEGEARFMMIGQELYRIEHYKYIGGVGGETETTIYKPEDPDFPANYKELQEKMEKEMGDYLAALKLPVGSLPLLWAADFIPVDGHKCHHVIGEFNCSCLGIAGFLNSRGKDLKDMTPEDAEMGQKMADLIGTICLEGLEK